MMPWSPSAHVLLLATEPLAPREGMVGLPLASIVIAVALAVALRVLWRCRADRRLFLIALVLGAGLMVGLARVGRVTFAAPWAAATALPDADDAVAIFEALNRNIYRAFDQEDESAVYDTLARSVTDDLLERTYLAVHESLALQEEGAAMCRVQSVSYLESRADVPADAGAQRYRVESRWRVQGTVDHWGHRHERTNVYHALFTIRAIDHAWKIAAIDVLDQQRTHEKVPLASGEEGGGGGGSDQ